MAGFLYSIINRAKGYTACYKKCLTAAVPCAEPSDHQEWCVLFRHLPLHPGPGGGATLPHYGRHCGHSHTAGHEVIRKKVREE